MRFLLMLFLLAYASPSEAFPFHSEDDPPASVALTIHGPLSETLELRPPIRTGSSLAPDMVMASLPSHPVVKKSGITSQIISHGISGLLDYYTNFRSRKHGFVY